jgi:hypothetical protein
LEVIAKYRALSRQNEYNSDKREFDKKIQKSKTSGMSTKWVDYLGGGICNLSGSQIQRVNTGEDINVYFDFISKVDIPHLQLGVGISHAAIYPWNVAYDSNISNKSIKLPRIYAGRKYRLQTCFEKPPLIPGVYRLNIMIRDGDTLEVYHHLDNSKETEFSIDTREIGGLIVDGNRPAYNALLDLKSNWEIKEIN